MAFKTKTTICLLSLFITYCSNNIYASDDPEYLKYQTMIRSKITQEWIIPAKYIELPKSKQPRAIINFKIDEDGEIVSIDLKQGSGYKSFDDSCVRAIHRASPFDIPPESIRKEAYIEGFLVEFSPKLRQSENQIEVRPGNAKITEKPKVKIIHDKAGVCDVWQGVYMSAVMQAQRALDAIRDGTIVSSQFGYEESMRRARQAYAKMINMGCKVPEY